MAVYNSRPVQTSSQSIIAAITGTIAAVVAGGLTGIGIVRGTDGTRTTTIRTMADTVPITMGLQDLRLRSPSEASVVAIGIGVAIGTGVVIVIGVAIGTGVDAAAGSS